MMQIPSIRRDRDWLTLLAIVGSLVYGASLSFEYVQWDDELNIAVNQWYKPFNFESLRKIWTESYVGFYTPLTYTVWGILSRIAPQTSVPFNLKVTAPAPFLYHLVNVVLHLASTFVVYLALKCLLMKMRPKPSGRQLMLAAATGAFLFLLHPTQAEPVSWVSGLRDVLSGFFALTSLLLFLRFLDKRHSLSYGIALLCFICAILSKPAAVVLPLALGGLALGWFKLPWKECLRLIAPWILITVPYIGFTIRSQSNQIVSYLGVFSRIGVAVDSVLFALYKLFFPLWLGCDYGRTPDRALENPFLPLFVFLPIAAGLGLYYLKPKFRGYLVSALLFFVFFLLPVSGLMAFISQVQSTVADRYLYTALFGAAMALAWAMVTFRGSPLKYLVGVVLFLFAVKTTTQSLHWRNTQTLYANQIRVNGEVYSGYFGMGLFHFKRGEWEPAKKYFLAAERLRPTETGSREYLGYIEAWEQSKQAGKKQ